MASIPLPALSIRPPEQVDPLQNLTKALSVKSLIQQQQAQKQAIDAGAQENQIRQQQMADLQAQTKAMQDWDGKNPDDLVGLTLKHGASANAVFNIKNKILEQKKNYSELAEKDATTGSKNLESLIKKNDLTAGALTAWAQGGDEDAGPRLVQTVNDLAQQGLIDPQHAQAAAQLAQLDPKSMRDKVGIFQKTLLGQKAIQEQAKSDVEIAEKVANTAKAKLETQALQSVGGATPAIQETRYNQILNKQAQGVPLTPADVAEANAYAQAHSKIDTKTDNLGFTTSSTSGPPRVAVRMPPRASGSPAPIAVGSAAKPQSAQQAVAAGSAGEDYLRTIPPQQRSLVKGIATYDIDPSRILMRNPQILDAVKQYDPTYDQGVYSQIQAARKEFEVGGKGAQSMRSLNQLIGHIGRLADTAKELNNTNIPSLNWVWNEGRKVLAPNVLDRFSLDTEAVAGELATLFKNGVGSEGEIKAWRDRVNPNMAKDSLEGGKSVINEAEELMASRFNSVATQYRAAMRGKEAKQGLLTEHSREILQKLPGGQAIIDQDNAIRGNTEPQVNKNPAPTGAQVTDPRGVVHTFPNQKAADNFKKAAGIQ
jgi:hypothetical protein